MERNPGTAVGPQDRSRIALDHTRQARAIRSIRATITRSSHIFPASASPHLLFGVNEIQKLGRRHLIA